MPNLNVFLQPFVVKYPNDTPPHSLKDSNVKLKVKTTKKGVGVCFVTCNISMVEGCAGVLGWELRQVTNGSTIHMDVHNPNNMLVSARLKHFWCTKEPRAYMDS